MLRFTLHFFVITLTLSTTSCMTGAGETDSELVYRYFTRGKYDVPFFLIDKEYQGTAGKVFFVRFSEGDADTLLAKVGINKTASHDFAWLIGMTVKLHGSGTIKYIRLLGWRFGLPIR